MRRVIRKSQSFAKVAKIAKLKKKLVKNIRPKRKRTVVRKQVDCKKIRRVLRSSSCATNNSFKAENLAFSIDHIVGKILSHSTDVSELLNYRAVCRRWSYFATQRLQKYVQIRFFDYIHRGVEKPLKELTSLLQQSNGFPCCKFGFVVTSKNACKSFLCNPWLKNFLALYGVFVKSITLQILNVTGTFPTEYQIVKQVRNLLIHQTPYLDTLILSVNHIDFLVNGFGNYAKNASTLKLLNTYLNDERRNTNLNVIEISGIGVSGQLLELIYHLAPNLKEVTLDQKKYIHFIEPQNKLHLFKKLTFHPYCYENVAVYEKIASASVTGLKIRELSFHLDCSPSNAKYILANALSMIMESSSDSIERISWYEVDFYEGFRFPHIMPNVKEICLNNVSKTDSFQQQIFPHEFRWSETFPNLLKLSIMWLGLSRGFASFLRRLHLEPMESVQRVRVCMVKVKNKLRHMELLENTFPNVNVEETSHEFDESVLILNNLNCAL